MPTFIVRHGFCKMNLFDHKSHRSDKTIPPPRGNPMTTTQKLNREQILQFAGGFRFLAVLGRPPN